MKVDILSRTAFNLLLTCCPDGGVGVSPARANNGGRTVEPRVSSPTATAFAGIANEKNTHSHPIGFPQLMGLN